MSKIERIRLNQAGLTGTHDTDGEGDIAACIILIEGYVISRGERGVWGGGGQVGWGDVRCYVSAQGLSLGLVSFNSWTGVRIQP